MKNRLTFTLPKWIIIVPVLIFLFYVSLDGINRYTIRRDELTTLGHIGALFEKPIPVPVFYTTMSLSMFSSNHAPLYFALVNMWGGVFEFNYFMLRILSVWFGMIAVAGTYWLGQRLSGHNAGFFAAVLLGTNILFYGNVHEMRDWTMLVMICVLAWMSYWHVVHKRQSPHFGDYFALFTLTAISLYTSFPIMFFWVSIGLYHLLAVKSDQRRWLVSMTVVAGGIAFVPWLPNFVSGIEVVHLQMIDEHPRLMGVTELIQVASIFWGNGLNIMFAGLIGLAVYASWKNWETARPIVFLFVTMFSGLVLANEYFLFVKRVRYIVYLTVPFSLFVGYGLAMLTRYRTVTNLAFIVVIVWMISGYQYTFTDEFNEFLAKDRVIQYTEYHYLVPILSDVTQDHDLLIVTQYHVSAIKESKQGLRSIHQYYMDRLNLRNGSLPLYKQWSNIGEDMTPIEYATELISQYEYFWFSYHHNRMTNEIIEFQMIVAKNYTVCDTQDYGYRSRLVKYVLIDKQDKLCITNLIGA